MQRASCRACQLVAGVIVSALAAFFPSSQAFAQTGPGWVVLLDGNDMGEWNQVGESNWRLEDGAVVADNRTSQGPAFLVSPESYSDFMLIVDFWASDDANSGVFLRCSNPEAIGDRTCFEANVFDQRPDPSYGTGAIVRHAEVDPMPTAGGKWNTFVILAQGRDITVVLNGEVTARLNSGMFGEGPIALQHGAGTIKFSRVEIRPL